MLQGGIAFGDIGDFLLHRGRRGLRDLLDLIDA